MATIFIVCIIAGYIQGFLKFGLSLFIDHSDPYSCTFPFSVVSDALEKFTPVDDLIEERCFEAFMPEIPTEELARMDLSGTPLENLSPEELENP